MVGVGVFVIGRAWSRKAELDRRLERNQGTDDPLAGMSVANAIWSCTRPEVICHYLRSENPSIREAAARRVPPLFGEVMGEPGPTLVTNDPEWCEQVARAIEAWHATNRQRVHAAKPPHVIRWNPEVPEAGRARNGLALPAVPGPVPRQP